MGSTDAVCGISGMAIPEGGEVVTMIIQRNPRQGDLPLYSFSSWYPASPLVRGTYDDYLSVAIDDDATAAWRATQESARRTWRIKTFPATDQHGERTVHVPHRLDYTYTIDGQRQEIGDSTDDDTKLCDFALWMAHAEVFDYLAATVEIDFDYLGNQRYTEGVIADAIEDAKAKGLAQMRGEELPFFVTDYLARFPDDTASIPRLIRSRSPWAHPSTGCYSPLFDFYDEHIWDAFEAGKMEEVARLISWWGGSSTIMLILQNLRKQLCDPGAVGQQHGHDQPFEALARAIGRQAEAHRYRFGNGEDEA
jgi:hypothetical protein